jgi:FtsP/CotA-like multicopper oxidase with cupredoxin domain
VRVTVTNALAEPTTVHWHGVRVPNAMDGVPGLTQEPIPPGGSFVYEFEAPDAGTYWYHSHQSSLEQVGRGLAGAFIVEEREAPAALATDREAIWVLKDWRLTKDAAIAGGFGNRMVLGMAGRIGNTVTITGRDVDRFPVRAGERVRLRLLNVAVARMMALRFEKHRPLVVALDGQPVEPHEPEDGRIVLGPAMRADIVLDMNAGGPGDSFRVVDDFYPDLAYRLIDLAYGSEPPLRGNPLPAPAALPRNTMPEPDLDSAERHEIVFNGGMMSGMGGMGGMMGDGMRGGMGMRGMMGGGAMWTINGVAAMGHDLQPMLTVERGRSCILAMRNESAWWHPIHLHGHSFRVFARDGRPTRFREWRDTVLIAPRESADVAFVADNPGDWMLHCHALDHQDRGMRAGLRVA